MVDNYVISLLSKPINRSNFFRLLKAEGELQQELFEVARETRHAHGGDNVLLRGVIEISNYCQKNCCYCGMRPGNKALSRYRLSPDVILETAVKIKQANIGMVFLQSGQDPKCDPILQQVIPKIKGQVNQDILLNVGEKIKNVYQEYFELGADSFILKFETSDHSLYEKITNSSLTHRLQCISWLKEIGFRVGTGNIVGLPGQTVDTLFDDLLLALEINPDFVSSSPFIPNQNTPFEDLPYGNLDITLNTMAILRVLLPDALIPSVSALEKIRKGGQLMGLNAGANVITINFTPEEAREKYAIYSQNRFVVGLSHAKKIIKQARLVYG
jgi:biotin synthase